MWSSMGRAFAAAATGAVLLTLGACDSGASAVAARDHSSVTDVTGGAAPQQASYAPAPQASGRPAYRDESYGRGAPAADDPRTLPVRLVQGKPVWAATRTLAAEDAAQANFEKNGADFGVKSVQAWEGKVRDFVDAPPPGAQTLKRPNGDTLIYDAKGNVFAVVTKDNAPRTMFKPTTGPAYWDQQKAENDAPRAPARRGQDG